MKVVELGVYHQGCWGSRLPEKYPEISMQESGPVQILQKRRNLSKVQTSWNVRGQTPEELENFLLAIRNEKSIKEFITFYKRGTRALIYTRWESPGSSYDFIVKRNCIPISPVIQENGYEKFKILTKNPAEIRRLLNELEAIGETKVYGIGDFREDADRLSLTEKQLLALRMAQERGYYCWPRNVTLEELASASKTTRRAFQENLRKAEAKVFPDYIKTIGKCSF